MKEEIKKTIGSCIASLNQPGKNDSAPVLEMIHAIAKAPYQGRGLGVGSFGANRYRASFGDMYRLFQHKETLEGSLDWKNAFLFLCDAANLTEEEILYEANAIEDNIIFNHVNEHIMANFILQKDLDAALRFIPHFRTTKILREENNFDLGYLMIVEHYAFLGDDQNFFKYLKNCEPGKNRSKLTGYKETLVFHFALNNSIDQALALCRNKNLGEKFYLNALYALAKQGKYQEAKTIFEQQPELKQAENETEIKVLVWAYLHARRNNQPIDDDFDRLFEKVLKVDRKIRWGDLKLQDSLLLDLGMASAGNAERIKQCKKSIKDSRVKQEL